MNFISDLTELKANEYRSAWRSPSNIALVKYWGKKGLQLPANPSVSMTLRECYTETEVVFKPAERLSVDVFLGGVKEEKFAAKIRTYLETLMLPALHYTINTRNTFPHGAGIASSASGLSALCLCLTDYIEAQTGKSEDFFRKASFLSRLASGSACRSVYGGFTTWGDESDLYASQIEVHSELAHLHDAVVVISDKEKEVSSTKGHGRMSEHPFAEARFAQARDNFARTKAALKAGDFAEVGRILEAEALSLHAMMMTSPEGFTLLQPKSLTAMEMVRAFRRETGIPVYYTLDAGPNLHLLYPPSVASKVETFVQHELGPLAVTIIKDQAGEGPVRC